MKCPACRVKMNIRYTKNIRGDPSNAFRLRRYVCPVCNLWRYTKEYVVHEETYEEHMNRRGM